MIRMFGNFHRSIFLEESTPFLHSGQILLCQSGFPPHTRAPLRITLKKKQGQRQAAEQAVKNNLYLPQGAAGASLEGEVPFDIAI